MSWRTIQLLNQTGQSLGNALSSIADRRRQAVFDAKRIEMMDLEKREREQALQDASTKRDMFNIEHGMSGEGEAARAHRIANTPGVVRYGTEQQEMVGPIPEGQARPIYQTRVPRSVGPGQIGSEGAGISDTAKGRELQRRSLDAALQGGMDRAKIQDARFDEARKQAAFQEKQRQEQANLDREYKLREGSAGLNERVQKQKLRHFAAKDIDDQKQRRLSQLAMAAKAADEALKHTPEGQQPDPGLVKQRDTARATLFREMGIDIGSGQPQRPDPRARQQALANAFASSGDDQEAAVGRYLGEFKKNGTDLTDEEIAEDLIGAGAPDEFVREMLLQYGPKATAATRQEALRQSFAPQEPNWFERLFRSAK